MAPPVRKKKNFSSKNRRLISSTAIGERAEQQPMGSLVTPFGKKRSVRRVARKTKKRISLKKISVCNDIWMDIFPFFDRPQLGLKLALISPRFNSLVDKHFDGKRELTIWRPIAIRRKDTVTTGTAPQLFVFAGDAISEQFSKLFGYDANHGPFPSLLGDNTNCVPFPLPDHPLHSKIRFECLQIQCIDRSVIAFLRANKQIFDRNGTNLQLSVSYAFKHDVIRPIRLVFVREIWPIFATNIRCLCIQRIGDFTNLRRLISKTILTDLDIHMVDSNFISPDATFSTGQALVKWLHTPTKDGQTKRLCFKNFDEQLINKFKKKFRRATTCASYTIQFTSDSIPLLMVPFDSVNVRTQEKLTLTEIWGDEWEENRWIIKRCKIGDTAPIQWEDNNSKNLSNVHINIM